MITPAVRAPRPRLSALERRESIVAAAMPLFAEKGFHGTTTKELAAAVGVSEPVLYEHFPSKRELFVATVGAKLQEGLAQLRELSTQYLDLEDDIGFFEQIGRMILDYHVLTPEWPRLMLMSSLEDAEFGRVFHQNFKCEFLGVIQIYLEKRMEAGKLRRVDPTIAARMVALTFVQLGQSHLFRGGPCESAENPYEQLDAYVDILYRGLRQEEESEKV